MSNTTYYADTLSELFLNSIDAVLSGRESSRVNVSVYALGLLKLLDLESVEAQSIQELVRICGLPQQPAPEVAPAPEAAPEQTAPEQPAVPVTVVE